MTTENLAKEIKSAVEWLREQEQGCSTIKLDDRLAVCIGWSNGFDEEDETVIHSKTSPTWAICAGIKVWTSDDLRTDFDWMSSPWYDNGAVEDTDTSIGPDENYEWLAGSLLEDYERLKSLEIEENGKVVS